MRIRGRHINIPTMYLVASFAAALTFAGAFLLVEFASGRPMSWAVQFAGISIVVAWVLFIIELLRVNR